MNLKKQSLSKNMILQFLYQGLILIVPMIISPYLTRTLQEKSIGIYSYTNSIAYYFVMLAMLGISRHGQRIISQSSGDEIVLRKNFWSLFAVHVIDSVAVLLLYFVFIIFFVKENKIIYFIQTFYVLSALFDITWLFYGLENFKSVVIKNAVVKIVECILIFTFVRNPGDLWKYTIIATGGLLVGQIVMLPQAISIIPPIKFTLNDCKMHIKPLIIFSISVIAASLYTVFDKTLLGLLTNKDNVAFYEYSNKIITIPKTIISVVGTVMFPRACRMAAEGNIEGQRKYINYSFILTSMIGIGSVIGLMAVGRLFAVVYFGKSFAICGNIIIALSPLIYIIGIGDIIRTQYMIPNHMDKQFNICILLNALVNIVLSVSLIPVIGIYGAVVGTVSAELFGIVYQLFICRKFIKIKDVILTALPFVAIGTFMFAVIKILQYIFAGGIASLLIEIIVGGIIYCIFTIIYLCRFKEDMMMAAMPRVIKYLNRKSQSTESDFIDTKASFVANIIVIIVMLNDTFGMIYTFSFVMNLIEYFISLVLFLVIVLTKKMDRFFQTKKINNFNGYLTTMSIFEFMIERTLISATSNINFKISFGNDRFIAFIVSLIMSVGSIVGAICLLRGGADKKLDSGITLKGDKSECIHKIK